MSTISVIMPTVAGREDIFARCVSAYAALGAGPGMLEMVIERDHPACGVAWQAGADRATGDYLHFTCDDIEPRAERWWEPAIEAVEAGFIPAPQVYGALTGEPQSLPEWGKVGRDRALAEHTTLPFLSRKQWQAVRPLLLTHYFSDYFVSDRARAAGWPTALRTGYAFTHHWAQPKRGAGMSQDERMTLDLDMYSRAREMAADGKWTDPWPPEGQWLPPGPQPALKHVRDGDGGQGAR